jgi:hypothetical protein
MIKMNTPIEKARTYISKLPLALSGQGGHNTTFRVACCLVHGFELSNAEAMILFEEYNAKLTEQWTDWELQHKLDDASRASHRCPRGYLLRLAPPQRLFRPIPAASPVKWPIRRKQPPDFQNHREEANHQPSNNETSTTSGIALNECYE